MMEINCIQMTLSPHSRYNSARAILYIREYSCEPVEAFKKGLKNIFENMVDIIVA